MPAIPSDGLDTIRQQIVQGMVEHEILAQALRAQCLVSAGFVLVLGLLSFWMWRRSVYTAEASVAQERRHSTERLQREEQHASEVKDIIKQHSLELDSITRTSWREFVEAVTKRP
jgi:uncharacterized protein HemX